MRGRSWEFDYLNSGGRKEERKGFSIKMKNQA